MQQAVDQDVYTALFAAAPRRRIDAGLSDYMKEVNEETERTTGLRYHAIYRELHGDVVPLDPIRSAYDRGVEARDFAEDAVRNFGFIRVGPGLERSDVAAFNRAQVAIVAFSGQTEDWVLTQTGKVMRQDDDGVAHLGPVRDRNSGQMGFGVRFYEGAVLTEDGRIHGDPQPINVAADFDIGSAVERFENERNLAAGMRFR